MGKDLLDDHFGRFWELPLELTKRGHDVQGLALSYRGKQAGSFSDLYGNLTWHSLNLLDRGLPAIHKYFRYAHRISTDSRPDIVWACSDAFHAILGRKVSEQVGAKCVIDLYDNFESYPATRVPGVLHLFRRVVKAADGITCVSSQLTNYVRDRYRSQAPTLLLENAVRADLFYPRDRAGSRRQLNLPQNARLIGTAGALHKSRAINTLYQAFEILVAEQKDLHLVLAGPRRQSDKIPRGERIHDLGNLPLEIVPHFLSALDVAVVSNRDSLFGRFNFPQKTREIMACRVPLVAAGVGTMNCLLSDHPELCFMPGNPQSLALAVGRQLANPIVLDLPVPAWTDMAKELESFFLKVLSNHA
ncbi:MAG TPA: glycosyltransferase [Terriglobales bacterium]|nr:glycosyltransferase [Terriglobales bacterium]